MDREIDLYLEELTVRTTSRDTRQAYRSDIADLRRYCGGRGVERVEQLDRSVLVGWLGSLRTRGLSEATVCRKAAALRGFLAWLYEQGYVERASLVPKVARPRRDLPRVLDPERVREIIATCGKRRLIDMRDRAMLEFLFATGCRVGELAALDMSDLTFRTDDGGIFRGEARVRGKGRKERMAYLTPRSADALRAYIDRARKPAAIPTHERAVFVTREGQRVNRRVVADMIRKRARDAGLDERVTAHWFRHSFATELLKRGASVEHVRRMLGHADASTTQVYLHLTGVDVEQAHRSFHPDS